MRMAGIFQDMLGQQADEEFAGGTYAVVSRVRLGRTLRARCDQAHHSQNEQDQPVIKAVGHVAGEIVRIGPDY